MQGRAKKAISRLTDDAVDGYVFRRDEGWPPIVPIGAAVIVAIDLAASVHQRTHFFGPGTVAPDGTPWSSGYSMAWTIAAACVAFFPYLLDAIGVMFQRKVGLPLVAFPIPVAVGIGYLAFHPTNIDFSPFVLVFTAAELVSRSNGRDDQGRRHWKIGAWGLFLGVAVMLAADIFGPFDGSFIWVIGISFGYFGGFMVGELDARKHELELAQVGLAEKAAADERGRIAREVHDVIAHSLSVTMLHVTAARMALEKGTGDPREAIDSLREAEQQGRRSFAEIRRTVGLLGRDADAAAPPMPEVGDLPKLIADFRSAGLDVSLSMHGAVLSLTPAAGLSLYRVVQESLTNVVKYAPGAQAVVDLAVDDADIRLRVHNTRTNGVGQTSDGAGLGIRGMIERANVLDGQIQAGPDADGWTVFLTAPLQANCAK